MPLRHLFLFKLIIGSILISTFIFFLINEIYLGIWTFAGPLLGLAMFVNGLTGSKIKKISFSSSNNSIQIDRESLFKSNSKQIGLNRITVELKTTNGKKNSFIPKIQLLMLDNDKEFDNLESNFLSMNNTEINYLYNELKAIKTID